MSNIQTGAERMPHDLSHLGFLAGQIGRLITISTTPVIAGDSFYYLPLKKGEICKIDLERGMLTRSPAPKNERGDNEVPGNLLFYDGNVISQTETAVTCYPQVEYKVAQISAQLKKDPTDPVA